MDNTVLMALKLLCITACLGFSTLSNAQNRVVVVPLGDSEGEGVYSKISGTWSGTITYPPDGVYIGTWTISENANVGEVAYSVSYLSQSGLSFFCTAVGIRESESGNTYAFEETVITNIDDGCITSYPVTLTHNPEDDTITFFADPDVGILTPVTAKPRTYEIGDTGPGGGTVFYVSNSGINGLEFAPADAGTAAWGCSGTKQVTSIFINSGLGNTNSILNGCTVGGTAADLADDYEFNGFTDWFLPSRNELNELFEQRVAVGAPSGDYWSSSDDDVINAWWQNLGTGSTDDVAKTDMYKVRPVRAF